jgi:hypothetical protein
VFALSTKTVLKSRAWPPPACCAEHEAKIWVEIEAELQGGSLKLYRKFPKGMGLSRATFEGIFEAGGPYGDGGYRLKLIIDKIKELEATAKISTRHEPAWVPKDCELETRSEEIRAGPR